jgi:lantibiotic modifying enzyme
LRGRPGHVLGPAHGFAGVVLVLARGNLLDAARRAELERRAVHTLSKYAQREDGLAQWPPALEPPRSPQAIRTQWCHGAPGIVASLGSFALGNDELTELLLEGGELTWRAGPLTKGAGLCHGTAGNGYAFLKLFERTGDELWLERARAFAMHALEQVERRERARFPLMTGAPGVALYVHGCLTASASFPTLDAW